MTKISSLVLLMVMAIMLVMVLMIIMMTDDNYDADANCDYGQDYEC